MSAVADCGSCVEEAIAGVLERGITLYGGSGRMTWRGVETSCGEATVRLDSYDCTVGLLTFTVEVGGYHAVADVKLLDGCIIEGVVESVRPSPEAACVGEAVGAVFSRGVDVLSELAERLALAVDEACGGRYRTRHGPWLRWRPYRTYIVEVSLVDEWRGGGGLTAEAVVRARRVVARPSFYDVDVKRCTSAEEAREEALRELLAEW